METAYTAFATQVIELCNGNVDTTRTIIALAYIEIELQHHRAQSSRRKEGGCSLHQQGTLFR